MTITVEKQLEILMKSNTISLDLYGQIPYQTIFTSPQIIMNKTIIDSKQNIWTHIPSTYYYIREGYPSVPIFYINNYINS